jgi:hypothetical protein
MDRDLRLVWLYCVIEDAVRQILGETRLRSRGSTPELTDGESLTIEIFGETLGLHLVKNPGMISDETICGVRGFHRIVFSDVSDAYQFFPSPLRVSDDPNYRANPRHGRITAIGYK